MRYLSRISVASVVVAGLTWDVDERAHTVTHHVDASLRSGEVDSDYVRPYELSARQLLLRYPVSGPDGEKRTRVLIWRRAERF